MTANKKMGAKLADSVRQAKEQQTQEAPSAPRQKEVAAPTKKEVTITTHFIPSKRVWPD